MNVSDDDFECYAMPTLVEVDAQRIEEHLLAPTSAVRAFYVQLHLNQKAISRSWSPLSVKRDLEQTAYIRNSL
jgi:hypothetical protein